MARRGGDERHDEALPWLEPAEAEDDHGTVISGRGLGLGILVLGGLLLLVVGLIYAQIAKPDEDDSAAYALVDGEAPLIAAPDAPFKARPSDPGGLDLEGLTQTAHEAAGGVDPGGTIALDALPEEPIDRSVLAANQAPAPAAPEPGFETRTAPAVAAPAVPPAEKASVEKPQAKSVATETAKAEPKPSAKTEQKPSVKTEPKNETKEPVDDDGSYSLQLGAFSSQAKANEAWKTITGRYTYLADLEKSVIALERDGEKLYRLRAAGLTSRARADNLCARLRVAGDQCSVVD